MNFEFPHQQALIQAENGIMAMISAFVRKEDYALHLFSILEIELAKASNRGEQINDVGSWCRQRLAHLIPHFWTKSTPPSVADQDLLALVSQAFEEQAPYEEAWQDREYAMAHYLVESEAQDDDILSLRYRKDKSFDQIAEACEAEVEDVVEYIAEYHEDMLTSIDRGGNSS
jgi:hypothetical protein